MTVEELRRAGAIARTPSGGLTLDGPIRGLAAWLDGEFAAMAVAAGAAPIDPPAWIEHDVLARAAYYELFGDGATRLPGASAGDTRRRSPAMCYHVYAAVAGQRIEDPARWTLAGTCHRLESGGGTPETRLAEFRMREIVFAGARAWVEQERDRWIPRVAAVAASLGLEATVVQAADPFFAPADRGRRLIQQLKGLKYELQAAIDPDEAPVAIASMNLHEAFFGSRFAITGGEGKAISSGCVAFGLERWALALAAQLDLDRAAALIGTRLAS